MAIDSSGSGSGAVSLLRDTISALRGLDNINRVNPTPDDPERSRPEDVVRISDSANPEPRQAEQQELTGLRQGLFEASAAGSVALAGAQSVAGTLEAIGSRLQQLADGTLTGEQRAAFVGEIEELVRQGLETVDRASFEGINLLDDRRDEDLTVAADREGGTETLRDQNLGTALQNLQGLSLETAADAQAALDGAFADATASADTAVRQLTEDTGRIGERLATIQERQAELAAADGDVDTGLDADTARQTAGQVAAQLQQSLDGQGLGVGNQRPEALVGLFR